MKNILFSLIFAILLPVGMIAQSVTLTFTGKDANNNRVQLDRVSVTNLTKGWQETIYWPDTTLTMQNGTGIDNYTDGGYFVLSQNNPNPFNGTTDVLLTVSDAGAVTLEIADVNGRIVVGANDYSPLQGHHQFHITLSTAGTYVMTARQNGKTSSIKMVNNGGGNSDGIEYAGKIVKTTHALSQQPKSHTRGITTNPFNFGDMMEYVGYATINGTEYESERISQMQGASQTFALAFAVVQHTVPTVITNPVSNISNTSAIVGGIVSSDGGARVTIRGVCWGISHNPTISNNHMTNGNGIGTFTTNLTGLSANTIYYVRAYATNDVGTAYGNEISFITELSPSDGQPCPGTETLTDCDGNTYSTVWIGSQCWMKENLRTTKYADNTSIMQGYEYSSTMAYWYYPNNNSSYKPTYGLLYNWRAVMRSSSSSNANPSGVQGICPTGWHVPSDGEWAQLTDYVSSQNQYQCNSNSDKIGKSLASNTGWESSTNTCAVGNNLSQNNATNFSAMPAGSYQGNYRWFGERSHFWSATVDVNSDSQWPLSWYLSSWLATILHGYDSPGLSFSVRCLRD